MTAVVPTIAVIGSKLATVGAAVGKTALEVGSKAVGTAGKNLLAVGSKAVGAVGTAGKNLLAVGSKVASSPITKSVINAGKTVGKAAANPAVGTAMTGVSILNSNAQSKAALQAQQDATALAAQEEAQAEADALATNLKSRQQLNSYGASLSSSSTMLTSRTSGMSSGSLLTSGLK